MHLENDFNTELVPLSFGQQQLWLIDRMQGHSAQYNLPDAQRVYGPLEVRALTNAFRDVVSRHQSLRSIIVDTSPNPMWKLVNADVPVIFDDLTEMEVSSKKETLDGLLESEWRKPFDLESEILIRVRIIKLANRDHIIVRTIHHLAFDGWSHVLFDRDLSMFYRHRLEGSTPPVEPLCTSYADFAVWNRSRFDQDAWDRDVLYWRRMLHNTPYELGLPRDRERNRPQEFTGAGCLAVVSAEQFQLLKIFCQSCSVTPFVALFSLYAALLSRYSKQQTLVVGYPATDRDQTRFLNVIGHFAKSMFARVDVDPGTSFRELVIQVNSVLMDGDLHRSVPFSVIADELLERRDTSITPFYQSTFAYQPRKREELILSGLDVEPAKMGFGVRTDLELYCWRHDDELELHWLYNRALFDAWRIKQLADHFMILLDAVISSPHRPLQQVPLLDEVTTCVLTQSNPPLKQERPPILRECGNTTRVDFNLEVEASKGDPHPDIYQYPVIGPIARIFERRSWIVTGRVRLDPFPGVKMYVLDGERKPTVPGIVGDIYVSNASLALGSRNAAPDVTTRFVPNPFGPTGALLYRTEDLGRWDRSGEVELVSRGGDYVWIREMLVDLSRVECLLRQQTEIEEAAVFPGTDSAGRDQLVAYISFVGGMAGDLLDVLRPLRQALPAYMIPERCVSMSAFPLNENGEIDRCKLRDFDGVTVCDVDGFTAPNSYCQEVLCALFAEVLEIDVVGVHDNFFDLGGHSLLVTRLINRIRAIFRITLLMDVVLEEGSPFLIAEKIERQLEDQGKLSPPDPDIAAKPQLKRRSR
jgi:hypothetical protein